MEIESLHKLIQRILILDEKNVPVNELRALALFFFLHNSFSTIPYS